MSPEIMNLLAFFKTFRLEAVLFCKDKGTFQMVFLPDIQNVNERFEVGPRIFWDLDQVCYIENTNRVTFKVDGEVFASQVEEGLVLDGRNLNGLVSVELRADPDRFPNWASEQAGQVKLVLKNKKEFTFPFARGK